MTYQYYIDFKDKIEYAKQEDHFVSYPIGALLFAYIDWDWEALTAEAAAERRSAFNLSQTAQTFHRILSRFDQAHHLLRQDAARLEKSSDPLYALYQWAGENEKFKQRCLRLIRGVLDTDGENPKMTVLQRYYLLNKTDTEFRRFKQKIHDQLKVFQCMMCGAGPQEPVDAESVSRLDITAAICYAADDLRALAFMEFEYMVTENMALRRCENCGRYFLPFSVLSRYCDRPAAEGKTCREVAIRGNYNRRLRSDDIRAAYVKNNNAYQMRTRRSADPKLLEQYVRWKQDARQALEELKLGTITEEEARERISLPTKKRSAAD